MRKSVLEPKKPSIILQLIILVLSILVLSVAFYSAINNKLLGFASILFIPLALFATAYFLIRKEYNNLLLRSILTGILIPFLTTIISLVFIFSYINSSKDSRGEGMVFLAALLLEIIIFIATFTFFLFYTFLTYFRRTRKKSLLVLSLILGAIVCLMLIYLSFLVFNAYDLSCKYEDIYDQNKCTETKCSLAPRDFNSCVLRVMKAKEKSEGATALNACEPFLTSSEKMYPSQYNNSEGYTNFKNCISKYLIENQASFGDCLGFEGVYQRSYQILCYKEYKEHQENLPEITCKDIEIFYEDIFYSMKEQSMEDFNKYCNKNSPGYKEKCESLKKYFNSADSCQSSYQYYNNTKSNCQEHEDLYNKYC
jgi:hypothetical protein